MTQNDPTGRERSQGADPAREAQWVRALARALVANREDALDLSQDLAVKALENQLPTDEPQRRAWLRTTARRLIGRKEETRAARRRREQRAAALRDATREDAATREEFRGELERGLAQLSEDDRHLISERYLENRKATEIAAAMGVHPDVIRQRVRRALERLRRAIETEIGGAVETQPPTRRSVFAFLGFGRPNKGSATSTRSLLRIAAAVAMPAMLTYVLIGRAQPGGLALEDSRQHREGPLVTKTDGAEPTSPQHAQSTSAARAITDVQERHEAVAKAPAPVESASTPPGHQDRAIRFIDTTGSPVDSVAAAWLTWSRDVIELSIDTDGTARLPSESPGWLVGSGPEWHQVVAEFTRPIEPGQTHTVELRAAPTFRGRVTIDGKPPGFAIRLSTGTPRWPAAAFAVRLDRPSLEELERVGALSPAWDAGVDATADGWFAHRQVFDSARPIRLFIPSGAVVRQVRGATLELTSSAMVVLDEDPDEQVWIDFASFPPPQPASGASVQHFHVVSAQGGQPLRAAVATPRDVATCDANGVASLPTGAFGEVFVTARGHVGQRARIDDCTRNDSGSRTIVLEPSDPFRFEVPASVFGAYHSNHPPRLRVSFTSIPFEEGSLLASADGVVRARELMTYTHGPALRDGAIGGYGAPSQSVGFLEFELVPGRPVEVDGLRRGAELTLEVLDGLGGVLARQLHVVDRSNGTLALALSEPVAQSILELSFRVEDGAQFGARALAIETPDGAATRLHVKSPRLRIGPLAPGRYGFRISADGARQTTIDLGTRDVDWRTPVVEFACPR